MIVALLLLAATTFTARQGGIVYMTFPHEEAVKAMELTWQQKKIPLAFIKDQNQWATVVGIDVDLKPGDYPGDLRTTYDDGHVARRPVSLVVEGVKFPTTELKVPDKYVELSPPNQRRAAREAKELDAIYATTTPQILWIGHFRSPIPGETGSNFGSRRVFNGQARAPHAGSDLRAKIGTPIHATNRGRVVLAKNLFFTGNTVVLDHGLGLYTIYAHMSRIDVKPSEIVDADQVIGLSGATGRVTGPHLHWSARIQSARVDPFSLLGIE